MQEHWKAVEELKLALDAARAKAEQALAHVEVLDEEKRTLEIKTTRLKDNNNNLTSGVEKLKKEFIKKMWRFRAGNLTLCCLEMEATLL